MVVCDVVWCVGVGVCIFTACLSDIYYEVSVYPEIQISISYCNKK